MRWRVSSVWQSLASFCGGGFSTIKRISDPFLSRFKSFYDACCYPSWRSWIAHTLISLGIGLLLSLFPAFDLTWGLTIGAAFFVGKELGDWHKWHSRGELMADDPSGVPRAYDGVGDLLGPVALALGAWIA